MGSDIGYLQTKISKNKKEIEELEKIVNSLKLEVHNKSKVIEDGIVNINKMKELIDSMNVNKIKEEVSYKVAEETIKLVHKSHEKNLEKNKRVMGNWWKEISVQIEGLEKNIMDGYRDDLSCLSKFLFKILKSNNLEINKHHANVFDALTMSKEKFEKKIKKLKRANMTEEGLKRLKSAIPGKNYDGAMSELKREKEESDKKVDELRLEEEDL